MFISSQRFPDDISINSKGGPGYNTTITILGSGHEERSPNWNQVRHRFDVAYGVRSTAQLESLLGFFHICKGRAHGFRFKNFGDYKSCPADSTTSATDQTIGTGDGVTTSFQFQKNYTIGSSTYTRTVSYVVENSVSVAIGGIPLTLGWSVDYSTSTLIFQNLALSIADADQLNPCIITSPAHGLTTGYSFHISGATGMTEINGIRTTVTPLDSDRLILDGVDASGFGYYLGGGVLKLPPQNGETISAGFEFDIPCRFDTDKLTMTFDHQTILSTSVPIVELR